MDNEPTEESSSSSAETNGVNLRPWERWISGFFGVIGMGTGGVAIFLTQNQAGTTTMLLLGAVFVLISIQGTPIRKASKDAVEWEKRVAADRAAQKASDRYEEEGPDAARAVIEGAAAVRPDIKYYPQLRAIESMAYRDGLRKALYRTMNSLFDYNFKIEDWLDGGLFDYIITPASHPDARIAVAVVHSIDVGRVSAHRVATAKAVVKSSGRPGIIVSDKYMPKAAEEHFSGDDTDVQFVLWRGPADDSALKLALSRVMTLG